MERKIPKRPQFPYCEDVVPNPIPTTQAEFVSESFEQDGRVLTRHVVKTVDCLERNKGKLVTDFCLENQISIGADNLNRFISYGDSNVDAVLANLDFLGSQMDKQAVTPSPSSSSESSES